MNAKQRIVMLWSSYLYLLHADGVHITTKRNWTTECISMFFQMMRSDLIRPDQATSEPSEHSFRSGRCIN